MAAIQGLAPGVTLQGRYEIVHELGRGGFGAVYLARDTRLAGRQVAVKENFDNSPEAQKQFTLEASLLASLQHPTLPRVSDHFIAPSGKQYLVMDYVEGEDLDEYAIRLGHPVSEQEAVAWARQILDALAYLHGQSPPVIHRDLKPANVKVTRDGRVMLVDFGIAKLYDPHRPTTAGAKGYTPGFSPLEQYGGGRTDARSDIYSLGATLYAVLTLEVPAEALARQLGQAQLIPPRRLNPALSSQLEQVLMRCLELHQPARFQSAQEMLKALGPSPSPMPGPTPAPFPTPVPVSPFTPAPRPVPPLPMPSAGGATCPQCGLFNRPGARFCLHCGLNLSGVSSPAPLPTPGPSPIPGPAPPGRTFPFGRGAGFVTAGALVGEVAGFALRPLLDDGAGYALLVGLALVGALVGLWLADRSRWKQAAARWELTVAGLVGVVTTLLCTAGVQWGGDLGGINWTFCWLAWLGGVSGGVAGAALTETDTFNSKFVPWGLQAKRSPGPFPYTRAIPWALAGGAVGWLLAFVPRLLAPGGHGDGVALLNGAGLVLWAAVGSVGATLYARQVDLGEDSTIYRLLGALGSALAWTLALIGAISLTTAIDRAVGLALLTLLGAAGGVLLGTFVAGLDRVRRFLSSLG